MSALDEKSKAERALKDLQRVQGEQQVRYRVLLAVIKHHHHHLSTFFFAFHFIPLVCLALQFFIFT